MSAHQIKVPPGKRAAIVNDGPCKVELWPVDPSDSKSTLAGGQNPPANKSVSNPPNSGRDMLINVGIANVQGSGLGQLQQTANGYVIPYECEKGKGKITVVIS